MFLKKTRWAMLLFVGLVMILGGCGGSTEPDPADPDVQFSFSPLATGLQLTVGQASDFAVSATGGAAFDVEWTLDGQIVGEGPAYRYTAANVGLDTLRVAAAAGAKEGNYTWIIRVVEDGGSLPPAVPGVTVTDGEAPAEVMVAWNFVGNSTYPIVEYLVACSFTGPIGAQNWDQANLLATMPHTGDVGYRVFLDETDGLIPGGVTWFAVRARDDRGQFSPVPQSLIHTVSYAWSLSGRVINDRGEPIPLVILHFEYQDDQTSSGADGSYQFGPISSVDSVLVSTTATTPIYYNYRSEIHRVAQGEVLDICLIEKYGADATCNANDGDFLLYLRAMTRTAPGSVQTRLYKWAHYPVACYIPPYLRGDGVDFGAMSREALAFWNADLGEEYLHEVPDAGQADLVFAFLTPFPDGLNGQVVLVQPVGSLGAVVPELVEVQIDADLLGLGGVDTALAVKGVVLHELGHALGLYDHSTCDGYRLMNTGSGAAAFQPGTPYPIDVDEHNAVSAIRRLPQAVDMTRYQ